MCYTFVAKQKHNNKGTSHGQYIGLLDGNRTGLHNAIATSDEESCRVQSLPDHIALV
jgi:hypothetical protein